MSATNREVDIKPLREAFVASGLTSYQVAKRLGWTCVQRGRRYPDCSRLKRALGIKPSSTVTHGRRYHYTQQRTSYARALEIAEALGVDPVEVNL